MNIQYCDFLNKGIRVDTHNDVFEYKKYTIALKQHLFFKLYLYYILNNCGIIYVYYKH